MSVNKLKGLTDKGEKNGKVWLHSAIKKIANHKAISIKCYQFLAAFEHLCVGGKDATSKQFRVSAWESLDINGNGHVSLAEAGGWIKNHLADTFGSADIGTDLYKYFYPCFIRAFKDAADYGEAKSIAQKGVTANAKYFGTATTDDYVQFFEFRLLCTYLVLYAVIWETFTAIDGGGGGSEPADRRISLKEWENKIGNFKKHPLLSVSVTANADDQKKVFAKMDADGKGMVLLSEFCMFIEDREFNLKSNWGKLLNAGEPEKSEAAAASSASA